MSMQSLPDGTNAWPGANCNNANDVRSIPGWPDFGPSTFGNLMSTGLSSMVLSRKPALHTATILPTGSDGRCRWRVKAAGGYRTFGNIQQVPDPTPTVVMGGRCLDLGYMFDELHVNGGGVLGERGHRDRALTCVLYGLTGFACLVLRRNLTSSVRTRSSGHPAGARRDDPVLPAEGSLAGLRRGPTQERLHDVDSAWSTGRSAARCDRGSVGHSLIVVFIYCRVTRQRSSRRDPARSTPTSRQGVAAYCPSPPEVPGDRGVSSG